MSKKKTREKTAEKTEFDKEFISDTFKPLTAKDRARWMRIKQKASRPKHKG